MAPVDVLRRLRAPHARFGARPLQVAGVPNGLLWTPNKHLTRPVTEAGEVAIATETPVLLKA